MTATCEKISDNLDLKFTAPFEYNWDNFSSFRTSRMSSIDADVKFKTESDATYTVESLSIPI